MSLTRRRGRGFDHFEEALGASLASHWLRAYEDKGRLLGYMGHATDDMLIDNYLRAVDRKTAALYWQIEPPSAPANVVPMTAVGA